MVKGTQLYWKDRMTFSQNLGHFFEHYIQRGMNVGKYYLYADEIGIGLTSDNTKDVTESCR